MKGLVSINFYDIKRIRKCDYLTENLLWKNNKHLHFILKKFLKNLLLPGDEVSELFWNLLAICETRPPSFLARVFEGPKTPPVPPRPPGEAGGASLTVGDSLCFICKAKIKQSTLIRVFNFYFKTLLSSLFH